MDHKLLKKFSVGACSPEEHARVIARYRSGEADKELSEQIEAYWKKEELQEAEALGKNRLFDNIIQDIPEASLAENRLWYSPNFGEDLERIVYFEGEAFYNVAKDTLHPFKIRLGEIINTDLGIFFNVQAFADEDITVSLASGKIQIEDQSTLNDRKFIYSRESREFTTLKIKF